MGLLIDGKWSTDWYASDKKGHFIRESTKFRDRVSADGSSGFPAVAGRYHLYVSYACPWAHRTLILRKLKGLEQAISVSVVDAFMGDQGWTFSGADGAIPDGVNGASRLSEIYVKAKPDYTGRVTVPVLWDKQRGCIVNNESKELIRMFDHEFGAVAQSSRDLCPPDLAPQVDEVIEAIYTPVNNGVYRAGFATTQAAYDEAVSQLFEALSGYDERLGRQRYLCGERFTEADVCFFTTLIRFDVVYHYHFKCNLARIQDFPNIWNYLKEIFQMPGVAETVNFDHIKRHYFSSHESINPTRIVPMGPVIDFRAPHDRARLPERE